MEYVEPNPFQLVVVRKKMEGEVGEEVDTMMFSKFLDEL
jgi:hypothetical protein